MLIATMLAAAAQDAAPRPASSPQPTNRTAWIAVDDYPAEALREHKEGVVSFTLDVDSKGKVWDCHVTASSGAESLDAQTCAVITARAMFQPARDIAGKAMAGQVSSRVRWVYPEIVPPPAVVAGTPPTVVDLHEMIRDGEGSSTLYVDANGIIVNCTPSDPGYSNQLSLPDTCGAYPVGSRYGPPTTFHGRPVRRKIKITIGVYDINQK